MYIILPPHILRSSLQIAAMLLVLRVLCFSHFPTVSWEKIYRDSLLVLLLYRSGSLE